MNNGRQLRNERQHLNDEPKINPVWLAAMAVIVAALITLTLVLM
jgi:hypothetical protein